MQCARADFCSRLLLSVSQFVKAWKIKAEQKKNFCRAGFSLEKQRRISIYLSEANLSLSFSLVIAKVQRTETQHQIYEARSCCYTQFDSLQQRACLQISLYLTNYLDNISSISPHACSNNDLDLYPGVPNLNLSCYFLSWFKTVFFLVLFGGAPACPKSFPTESFSAIFRALCQWPFQINSMLPTVHCLKCMSYDLDLYLGVPSLNLSCYFSSWFKTVFFLVLFGGAPACPKSLPTESFSAIFRALCQWPFQINSILPTVHCLKCMSYVGHF